jgi:hypothetical protein
LAEVKAYFEEQKTTFAKVIDECVPISLAIGGREADEQKVQASIIFARMCATAHSIKRLLFPIVSDYGVTIDHSSIERFVEI